VRALTSVTAAQRALLEAKIGYSQVTGKSDQEYLDLFQEQIKLLEQELAIISSNYKAGDGAVSASDMQRARSELIKARIRYLEQRQRIEKKLDPESGSTKQPASQKQASTGEQSIRRQLDAARDQLRALLISQQYGEKHPKVRELQAFIDRMASELDSDSEFKGTQAQGAFVRKLAELDSLKSAGLYGEKHPRLTSIEADIERFRELMNGRPDGSGDKAPGPETMNKTTARKAMTLQLDVLEAKKQDLDVRYGPEHPRVVLLREQIAGIESALDSLKD
jgi:uncharacterized protein involved in exopolysaccharide biosynthesis